METDDVLPQTDFLAVLSGALMASCLFNPQGFSALLFVAGGVHNVYVLMLSIAYVFSFAVGLWQLQTAFGRDRQVSKKRVVTATVLTILLLVPQWLFNAAPIAIGYLGMPHGATSH